MLQKLMAEESLGDVDHGDLGAYSTKINGKARRRLTCAVSELDV
jgi:hypothetical protein